MQWSKKIAIIVNILSIFWLVAIWVYSGVSPLKISNHFLWYIGFDSSLSLAKVYPIAVRLAEKTHGSDSSLSQGPMQETRRVTDIRERFISCEDFGCSSQTVTEILRESGLIPLDSRISEKIKDASFLQKATDAHGKICRHVLDSLNITEKSGTMFLDKKINIKSFVDFVTSMQNGATHCAAIDPRGPPYYGIALALFVISAIFCLTIFTAKFVISYRQPA